MFVREVMTRQVGTVGLTATIDDMRRLIRSEDLLAVAVIHRREPIAVLTRQALERWPDEQRRLSDRPWIEQLGAQRPILVAPDDLVSQAAALLRQDDATMLLVVDHHDVVGAVTVNHV